MALHCEIEKKRAGVRLKTTIQLNGLITTIGNNEGIATQ